MQKGILYLIPTPITDVPMKDILLPPYLDIVKGLELFVVENAKTARAHLSSIELNKKIQEIEMYELSEHTKVYEIEAMIKPLIEGKNVGLMSEAGVPSIADPGYRLVIFAQKNDIKVVPFVGPSSIFLALMASGLSGQNFAFNGYLPQENRDLRKAIKSIEVFAKGTGQTQIFMEAPYRNQKIFENILSVCEDDTYLCVAQNIMGENEFIKTESIAKWRKNKIRLDDVPCLFLINKI